MTDIIILTSGDAQRAHDIAELFEGGNRVRVVAIADNAASPLDLMPATDGVWLVVETTDYIMPELRERFGERVVTLAPHRTAPEAAADIIASIRGAGAAEADPDVAWARTLGLKYDAERVAGQTPPPIPQEALVTPAGRPAPAPEGAQEPMPPTYLVWSVVMTVLCCLPAGVVAIVFSSMVSSKYYAGDLEGARRASRRAEIWIIVSFVLGVLWSTLYIPLMIAGLGS